MHFLDYGNLKPNRNLSTNDGCTQINVQFEQEVVWLKQAQIGEFFETSPQNITMHLKGILKEEEINERSTCKEFLQVRKD